MDLLLMEVRSRLQSVNVFVKFNKKCDDVKIELFSNSFKIILLDYVKVIECNFEIVPNSLTILLLKDNWLSFRIATTNSNKLGSHRCEILPLNELKDNYESVQSSISPESKYDLKCVNCTQLLSQISFKRVLPLPSDNLELGNWFCHGDKANYNLAPKDTDIFYRDEYATINRTILNDIITRDSIVYCKRCSAWLGLLKSSQTVKFWFHTISLDDFQTDPFTDACQVIRKSLEQNCNRLLLNYSGDDGNQYLLIWIIEKQLNIVLQESNLTLNESVAKVLYKYESTENNLVQEWQKNLIVHCMEISKLMMTNLVDNLGKMNEYVPRDFAQSNEFSISYLRLNV